MELFEMADTSEMIGKIVVTLLQLSERAYGKKINFVKKNLIAKNRELTKLN